MFCVYKVYTRENGMSKSVSNTYKVIYILRYTNSSILISDLAKDRVHEVAPER